MKVFVWKSFGEIKVYAFETKEQKENLKAMVIECLENEGVEGIGFYSSFWYELVDEIEAQIESRSDIFEYGTGFTTMEE